ncbi:MAG: IS3 family transposase [Leptolinea sp.]
MSSEARRDCITAEAKVTITEQCDALGIPRSTHYYEPKEASELNQTLTIAIKALHEDHPELGSPKMTQELIKSGHVVNHKRIEKLMHDLGLFSLLPGPKTTKRNPRDEVFPYALGENSVSRPNDVWSTDITYLKLPQGHVFLVAIIDWFSRKVLAWRISNTMDVHFCLEALDEAIRIYGAPIVFNSDQGSQFTSRAFTDKLIENNILISMDGKRRAIDNVVIERFWWTIKYENLFLRDFPSLPDLRIGVSEFIKYYNSRRLHQSLDYQSPNDVFNVNRKGYYIRRKAA